MDNRLFSKRNNGCIKNFNLKDGFLQEEGENRVGGTKLEDRIV